jgi:ubiquinone/menaquinone biosynthesis C-methylase UbiE
MTEKKGRVFDPAKLQKLNNPDRLRDIPPEFIWEKLGISPPKPATFVEIGAGTGFFSRQFLKYTHGGTIYACDISEVMVDWMEDNIRQEYPGIIPLLMEDSTIPLKDASADLIYTINVHHEFPHPERAMGEAFRILRPLGSIFIADWRKEPTEHGPRTEIRYETGEVRHHLEQAGFTGVEIHEGMRMHFLVTAVKPG